MALLSTILDRVQDELPTVPEPVVLRALADSVREFCRRTHSWQEELPAVRTREGATEYELFPDDGVMVVALKEVRDPDGQRIPPYAGEFTRLLVRPISTAAKPLGFMQRSPLMIELINPVDSVQRLSVVAALTLAQGQTEVDLPDALLDEYAEALGAGAKMRLVKQRNTSWFAPEDAPMHAAVFYRAVSEAKRRVMTSMGEADLRLELREWV